MSLHVLANHMASKGRDGDSMLVHMTPGEVHGLQALAMKHGGSLTTNPDTGLPEANFLKSLLPILAGFALGPAGFGLVSSAMGASAIVGGITGIATGSLSKGLMAGLGAYGGFGIGESLIGAGAGTAASNAAAMGVEGAATGVGSQASMLAEQNAGFGAEGLTRLADSAKVAAGATPSTTGMLSTGFDTALKDPMAFAKQNWKPIAAAALPILSDIGTTTPSQAPTMAPGRIREKRWDGRQFVDVASTDAGVYNTSNRNFSDLYRGYNDGGIVALAEGGDVIRMAKGTPPAMLTDEQLYQQTGDWNKAAALRDQQNAALNTYNLTDNAAVGANINKWITDNPFASTVDINNAIKTSGLTQDLVNPYLTANTNISDAARYALSHATEMPGAGGLAGLNANILKEFKTNPGMNQASIDRLQDIYKVSDADIQRPLSHGSQVAATDMAKAQNYLNTNPDVMAWVNSAEGKAYIAAHPEFDASDIAFTHYQRYGAAEGRKWEAPTTIVSTCPAPDMRILLANGNLKAAGDLQIGDVIKTQHETTLAWGDHPVTHVSIVPDVPRLKIKFGDVEFVCSLDHKFFKAAGEWVTAKDVVLGDMLSGHTVRSLAQADVGDVVRITVDDAHTYICEGLLSHNKSPQAPVVNPPTAINATQNTTTDVTVPTDLYTAPASSLPVGVSGNTGPSQIGGGATVNPNGTITTSPRIPGIPVGGFTGMQNLRDVYTKGGGSLGYTSPTFKTIEDFNAKYLNRMGGDSKAAYDYLTGKGGAKYPTKSGVGRISEAYDEAVLGYPARGNLPYIYNKTTGKMDVNPDYVAPGRDSAGNVTYSMSLNDIKSSLKETPLSGQALYDWAISNNLSAQQIADATGRSLSSVYSDFRAGSKAAAKKKADDIAAGIFTDQSGSGSSDSGGGPGGTGPGGVGGAGGPASTTASESIGPADDGGDNDAVGGYYSRGKLNYRAKNMAMGGATGYALGGLGTLGGYSDGGRLLRGPGDGVSDSIPATIGRKQQPARLADGEFVVPARIVSELGNGSTDAGAKKLYAMLDRVQRARGKTTGKNKVAANSRADKYLPA